MEKGRGTMPRSVRVVRAGRKYEGGPSRLFRHLCRMVTRICVPVLQVQRQVHLDVPVKKCTYLWLHLASTVSPADRPMVPPLLSRHTLSIHCPTLQQSIKSDVCEYRGNDIKFNWRSSIKLAIKTAWTQQIPARPTFYEPSAPLPPPSIPYAVL